MPPPQPQALTIVANTTALVALLPTLSGAFFLLHPGKGMQQMNFSSGSVPAPTAKEREEGLLRMYAVRQCVGGRCSSFLLHP